jgi:hypothetical protein
MTVSRGNADQQPAVLFQGLLEEPEESGSDAGVSCLSDERRRQRGEKVRLVCPDDDTAKEYARQLTDGHATELWQGEKQIGRFTRRDA